uniref:Uncharacterized protein n=1 Tax=Anopheles dirus TaxID=7168 RepID=A0A182NIG2_9DIPT
MATVATGSAGSLVDPSGPAAGQKQRKKGKFRLKERSSSSVREKFINDPAYTEDVRHLALPMRRNSGPEHDPGRKFYMISKKKSNSVGKDYSRGSGSLQIGRGGGDASGSGEFYTLDVESIRRAGLNVPEVKPRRKKYNHHSSAELLNRLLNTDESSSSDGVRPKGGHTTSTLDRSRGRSLDRRSYAATGDERAGGVARGLSISRPAEDPERDGGRQQQRGRKIRTGVSRRENSEQDVGALVDPGAALGPPTGDVSAEDVTGGKADDRETGSSKGGRFQIGKRFLKGEIGIKSFNYYLLKEGLKSSKKSLLKQRSAPVAVAGSVDMPLPEPPQPMELVSPESEAAERMVEKGEENIYEEIYFEDKPKRPPVEYASKEAAQLQHAQERHDASDEKIQFIDCELCVQQCSNANCDVCHGLGAQHTAQQHEHHHHQLEQQRQAEQKQQNIYEQLKQHGSGNSSGGSGQSGGLYSKTAAKSMDVEEKIYQRQRQPQQQPQPHPQKQIQLKQPGDSHAKSMGNLVDEPSLYAGENVLQYQSYNPSNPNVYKLETTPVAFSCDYSPLQQIYYKQPPPTTTSQADAMASNPRQHIYQRPHQPGGTVSSGSDYYQELNHKKSSSSSDSLQQQQRRLQSSTGIYYQRAAAVLSDDQHRSLMSTNAGAKIYKVSSNASILSEASGRSEGSYRQAQQQVQQQIQSQYQPLSSVVVTTQREHHQAQAPSQTRPQQLQQQSQPQQQPQQQQQQPYGRTGGNMSDSSLGDSLFSYPANRRYFGSSESCRFASESCRRCSVEVDKCSFSDTCRYSDCRNCDCSSSYFSSDFDDTTAHGGPRNKSGSRTLHAQPDTAGYYQAPPYAEDFMKHVSAVKRGNQQQQQQQQQMQHPVSSTHLLTGSKIYETPPTYVGMMPVTAGGLQKAREPTYETLRNPPYSIPMVGPSYESTPLVTGGRLSISQSHEALLSPLRRSRSSRSTDTDQYPQLERRSPVSHYSKIRRPHQSNTLPASMRSGRRQQVGSGEYDPAGYSVIRENPNRSSGPGPGSGGSTLPKSFSMQQPRSTPAVTGRSASLLTMGHEYAEISKPNGRKPIPPPISTIPSNRDGRARSKQPPAAVQRAVSPSLYARTGPSGIAGSSAGNTTLERKSRERSLKQGRSSDTPVKDRSPASRDQQTERGKSGRDGSVPTVPTTSRDPITRSGKPTTGSTRRKEFVRSQQQQHRSKRPARGNFTDDEDDDEVFLSDKVYERPVQNNRSYSGDASPA